MKTRSQSTNRPTALLGLIALGLCAARVTQAQDTLAEKGDFSGYAVAHGDFNGDGYDDVAFGEPWEDIGSYRDTGAVDVIYGGTGGLGSANRQYWNLGVADVEGTLAIYDYFGAVLASGDFNADGYDDLAVGSPSEIVNGAWSAGAVHILYGSSSGLSATIVPDQLWSQDSPDVEDVAESSDFFGAALAAGDFNADGYADLAIGVRGEDLSSQVDAGGVNVLYGSGSGLSATAVRDQRWNQDVNNVEDVVEAGDSFGAALAAADFNADGYDDLAVGVSGESVNGVLGAGAVNVLYGAVSGLSATVVPDQRWHQDVAEIEDQVEGDDRFGSSLAAGDFNADGYSDLAVGVPGEDLSSQADAGEVNVIYGSVTGLSATAVRDQRWNQDVNNVEDVVEAGDLFGTALAVGDFNADGYEDLAIGAPAESVDSQMHAGEVNLIYGASSGLSATVVPDQRWHQNVDDVDDAVEMHDMFGSSLAAGDFNADGYVDLAIGAPYESIVCGSTPVSGAGAVNVLYGAIPGLNATSVPDQFLTQACP